MRLIMLRPRGPLWCYDHWSRSLHLASQAALTRIGCVDVGAIATVAANLRPGIDAGKGRDHSPREIAPSYDKGLGERVRN